jgi:poly(3-hydroxybutyrate) depolymerase
MAVPKSNKRGNRHSALKTQSQILRLLVLTSLLPTWLEAASTVQFSAGNLFVAESAGTATLLVQRTGDTNTVVTVDYATADGTATSGLKYTAVSGTLTFAAGETNKTIVVPILNEGFVEGTKSFLAILSNPTGGAVLGTPVSDTVFITDNDVGIQFQFASYSFTEDAGAVVVGVVRGDDGNLPVTIGLAAVDGTATNTVDYLSPTNTLAFAPQERLKFVSVPIINNSLKQPNRTFNLRLANAAGATLGAQTTVAITIVDNDQGFQFASTVYNISEDAGAAQISVLRGTDATNSTFTVGYATSDGSATTGVDYTGMTNTLTFGPGERVKQVAVPILNNGTKQASRSFHLALSNPTGGAVLGSPTATTVSILDNDPGVGFERTAYTNGWGQGGNFAVTVLRGNDWFLGPITVDYTTANLTATAGQDYQAVSGTLEFQPNETIKAINIPILRNRAVPGAKTLRVVLSNTTGGAILGTASVTVSIQGSYATLAPAFDTALSVAQDGDLNILNWNGGGQLQRADRPMGPWQTLTNATNPYTLQSPVSSTFYRVTRPRPVNLYVPSNYDGQTPVPLVILLHGYGSTGVSKEAYFQFLPLAEARGFLYCYPDSPPDQWGGYPWNATDACCDYGNTGINDAGYLRGVIEEIGKEFTIDRKRIHLVGHSNGGFMAYRMACQSADLIAGIASLAGMTFLNPSNCAPSGPVNILHIQGSADETISYDGGALTGPPSNMPAFPSAMQTVQLWAGYNGASSEVTDAAPSLDLTTDVAGLDTVVTRYTNFPPGGAVELWTINGGLHTPTLSTQFSPLVIDWLLAHPKP